MDGRKKTVENNISMKNAITQKPVLNHESNRQVGLYGDFPVLFHLFPHIVRLRIEKKPTGFDSGYVEKNSVIKNPAE